jgi:hypothetical protein
MLTRDVGDGHGSQPPADGVDRPSSAALEYTSSAAAYNSPTEEFTAVLRGTLEQLGHSPKAVEEAAAESEKTVQAGLVRIAEEQRIVAEMNRLSEAQRARVRRMKVNPASRALLRRLSSRTSRPPRGALRGSPRRSRNIRSRSAKARAPGSRSSDDDPPEPEALGGRL